MALGDHHHRAQRGEGCAKIGEVQVVELVADSHRFVIGEGDAPAVGTVSAIGLAGFGAGSDRFDADQVIGALLGVRAGPQAAAPRGAARGVDDALKFDGLALADPVGAATLAKLIDRAFGAWDAASAASGQDAADKASGAAVGNVRVWITGLATAVFGFVASADTREGWLTGQRAALLSIGGKFFFGQTSPGASRGFLARQVVGTGGAFGVAALEAHPLAAALNADEAIRTA